MALAFPENVDSWTPAQCLQWVRQPHVAPAASVVFEKNAISGRDLKQADEQELMELGLSKFSRRVRTQK